MAQVITKKQEIERPDIIFYIYDKRNNKLRTGGVRLIAPFNIKTQRYATDVPNYYNIIDVYFNDAGFFKLSLDNYSKEDYDMIKEWLSYYNDEGGVLSKCYGKYASFNGMKISSRGKLNYVSIEEIKDKPKDVVKEVVKEVKVNTIPRVVAETMDFTQLRELAKAWGVEIPENIQASGKPEEIKKEFLKILSEHLTD